MNKIKDMKNEGTLIEYAIVAAIAFLIVLLTASISSVPFACESKAKKMGVNYDWGLIQGCMVEVKQGQWVTLNNYRVSEFLEKQKTKS